MKRAKIGGVLPTWTTYLRLPVAGPPFWAKQHKNTNQPTYLGPASVNRPSIRLGARAQAGLKLKEFRRCAWRGGGSVEPSIPPRLKIPVCGRGPAPSFSHLPVSVEARRAGPKRQGKDMRPGCWDGRRLKKRSSSRVVRLHTSRLGRVLKELNDESRCSFSVSRCAPPHPFPCASLSDRPSKPIARLRPTWCRRSSVRGVAVLSDGRARWAGDPVSLNNLPSLVWQRIFTWLANEFQNSGNTAARLLSPPLFSHHARCGTLRAKVSNRPSSTHK